MATYVIGDIHGCLEQLQQLLQLINFDNQNDTLWFTGDLINRGPQSLETLRFIKSLGSNHICVLGNHDLVLLALHAKQLTLPKDRSNNFDQILEAVDSDELLQWLQTRPVAYYDAKFNALLVHAGVLPQWSLEQILSYAGEIETALQGPNAAALFKEMYGNLPDTWSPNLIGWNRLRFLMNCFTRMRFCSKTGQLDLAPKGIQPALGFDAWFEIDTVRDSELTILFGHWAALLGKTNKSNFIGLDTGCVWGHQLTALRLEDRKYFAVPGLSLNKHSPQYNLE